METPKGGTNTNHSKKEKLSLVLRNLQGEILYVLKRETGGCIIINNLLYIAKISLTNYVQ